jgi:hypothetical protein
MSDAVPAKHGRQPTELLQELATASGDANMISVQDVRASFETAWTRRYRGERVTVALATTTSGVAGALRLCGDRQQPVVVQGGNTGLVGANVPRGGVPWGETVSLLSARCQARMRWTPAPATPASGALAHSRPASAGSAVQAHSTAGPEPSLRDEYDIAVVGGGIVGLAPARELLCRRPDRHLVLLERERPSAVIKLATTAAW